MIHVGLAGVQQVWRTTIINLFKNILIPGSFRLQILSLYRRYHLLNLVMEYVSGGDDSNDDHQLKEVVGPEPTRSRELSTFLDQQLTLTRRGLASSDQCAVEHLLARIMR